MFSGILLCMEEVDVLAPPMFEPTGGRMTATEAILAGKWLGAANVWVYRFVGDEIEFLYQEREPNSPWMPGKLDVAAGGYFKAGEPVTPETRLAGAMRELKEEIGLTPKPNKVRYITSRLNVGISQKGNERKSCCSVYALEFDGSDFIFKNDAESGVLEAVAICWISLKDILRMHADPSASVTIERTASDGTKIQKQVNSASFCVNYDGYLLTMPAMIASIVTAKGQL